MIKKILITFSIFLLVYLIILTTYNYTIYEQKNKYNSLVNDCLLNKNLDDELILKINSFGKGFECVIENKSKCVVIDEIQIKIGLFLNGKGDTINLTLTDNIDVSSIGSIRVEDVENDSLVVIQSMVKKILLN